jgi:DNA/RNA-binding domain of Phe-tRNA-synthetase-like protein
MVGHRQGYNEFVSGETRNCVTIAETRFQSRRNQLQKAVAHGVPKRVVHILEPVQIEQK